MMKRLTDSTPVTLFYSYAHEDEALRDELQGHLKLLERRGLLAPWHDRRIVPGADWSGASDGYLRKAELVLQALQAGPAPHPRPLPKGARE